MRSTLDRSRWPPLTKRRENLRAVPNLVDCNETKATFTWQSARRLLDGLPGGRGLNIAHEAVDRHATGANGRRVAFRWIARNSTARDITYAELSALTNRFANALAHLGVGPGETLRRGDIIAVVDTEKGAIEIEVFEDGVLEEIRVQPGEKVPVGTVLAVIQGAEAGAQAQGPQPPPAGAPSVPAPAPSLQRVSPAARSLAAELHIDLASIRGTGPGGVITRTDVERSASSPAPTAAGASAPNSAARMRQAIAAAMAQSKREIPHFYLGTTIDMSRALAWLASENASRSVPARLLPAALLIKSVALALREVPGLNGFWADGAYRAGAGIHPGVAVSLRGGGLVAPAIHDADQKDLTALMAALRDLVARARAGGLKSSELSDPTTTITNLGEQGVEIGYGIIYPPQVALVSFGKIVERPIAVGGHVVVRSVLSATLSADHRAVDGHRAGLFLSALDRHLQEPERL